MPGCAGEGKRDVELFDCCPERFTLRLVEILDAVCVANVGVAVDKYSHRPTESTWPDAHVTGRFDE